MRNFRNKFRAEAPFAFKGLVEEAYKQMEKHAADLLEKEVQVRKYNELEDLFELQVSKYPETQDTRMELRLLKGLWDSKAMVDCTYVDWRTALWSQINTEALDDENKVLLKQLRKQGSDFPVVKGWQVYRDIEDSIKNMGVVLPLINDLHSPAMRVRHWKSLAAVCEVKAVNPSDAKFTMDDMMQLNLHSHVEDVSMIVETAQKELKIENKLEVIEAAWKDMVLHYVPHKDTEMFVVRPSEELVESLEAHQMELQSMVGMGKFVDFFRDRVMHWQKTLGSVEEVLKLWANVSRNWASLESIFLASADIRSQLPDGKDFSSGPVTFSIDFSGYGVTERTQYSGQCSTYGFPRGLFHALPRGGDSVIHQNSYPYTLHKVMQGEYSFRPLTQPSIPLDRASTQTRLFPGVFHLHGLQ